MFDKIKIFFKNSGIFVIGNMLSKLIVFFLLPLYTNLISPSDFGYYDISIIYISIITSILYFDIWATVLRFMYDYDSPRGKQNVINLCWLFFSISSLIFIVICTILMQFFAINYGLYIIFYGLSFNLSNFLGFIARGWKKNVDFVISGIINTIVMVSCNLIFLMMLDLGIKSLYLAAIFGFVAQSLYLVIKVKVLPKIKGQLFEGRLFKSILIYTLPLCINSVAYWLLTSYNRIVIQDIYGLSYNGIYAIGHKITNIIALLTTCFAFAWQDLAFSHMNEKNKDKYFFSKAFNYYMIFLSIGLTLLLPCINIGFSLFIGHDYKAAFDIIPLFFIMTLLSAFSHFIGNIFYAIKDTKTLFISVTISCLINLILSKPLIMRYGINGANLAIAISFFFNIVMRVFILRKQIKFKIKYTYLLISIFILAISIVLYLQGNKIVNLLALAFEFCVLGGFLYKLYKKKKELKHD